MAFARAARRSATIIAALALTSGCLSSGEDGSPGGSDPGPGRQQLTEAQAKGALPEADSLPEELRVTEDQSASSDDEATAYPATCLDARLEGTEGQALDEHEQVKESRSYTGPAGGLYTVHVVSYDIPVPEKLFDDAGAAQGGCGEFRIINQSGTTKWGLIPSTFTPLGDRTYVMQAEVLHGDEDIIGGEAQLVGISVGHNLVRIVHAAGPQATFAPTLSEGLAKTTVENLESL